MKMLPLGETGLRVYENSMLLFLTSACEFMIISKNRVKLMQGKGLGSVGVGGRQQS